MAQLQAEQFTPTKQANKDPSSSKAVIGFFTLTVCFDWLSFTGRKLTFSYCKLKQKKLQNLHFLICQDTRVLLTKRFF